MSSSPMAIDGLAALTEDIYKIEAGSKVPVDLDWHVFSEEETHKIWYKELLNAWKVSKPTTPIEATELVYNIMQKGHTFDIHIDDIEGFLCYYGLTGYSPSVFSSCDEASPCSKDAPAPRDAEDTPLFQLKTLPVSGNRVLNGVSFTVSIGVKNFSSLPNEIVFAVSERCRALAKREDFRAKQLLNEINNMRDYEVLNIGGEEILTKKFEIRLRGIRAPETDGTKLRDELARMLDGKCLKISVYSLDEEGYCIGDVYRNDKHLQGILVKKGYRLETGTQDMEMEPLQ